MDERKSEIEIPLNLKETRRWKPFLLPNWIKKNAIIISIQAIYA